MTFNPVPINVPNYAGVSTPLISYNDGTNNSVAHVLLDNTGALIAPATSGNQVTANTALVAIESSVAAGATAAGQATANTALAAIEAAVQAATPAGTNLIGSVNTAANTSGGTSTYAALGGTGNALLTNSPVAVKASAGNLYGLNFVNKGVADAYVQVFDLASGSVTLGTTVPKLAFWVPAGGSWEEKFTDEAKISFATAITVGAATTATGNTAPATGILANILYK